MQSKNSVITWVIILAVILVAAGAFFLSRGDTKEEMTGNTEDVSGMVEVSGATAQLFEGQNILSYTFYIPGGMSAVKGEDTQTLIVRAEDNSQKALAYFSYEGGRGWSPEEYFNTVIAPKVPVQKTTSTVHVGSYDWYHVETATMEWNIAKVKNGEWLMMIESKKADTEAVNNILKTLKAE